MPVTKSHHWSHGGIVFTEGQMTEGCQSDLNIQTKETRWNPVLIYSLTVAKKGTPTDVDCILPKGR